MAQKRTATTKQAASKAKSKVAAAAAAAIERRSDWPSNPGKAMRANGHVLISVWASTALRDAIHARARATGKFHSDIIRQTLGAAAEEWSGMGEGTLQTLRPLVPSNVPRDKTPHDKALRAKHAEKVARAVGRASGKATGKAIGKKTVAKVSKTTAVSPKKDNGNGKVKAKGATKGGKGAQNARKPASAARGGTKSGAGVVAVGGGDAVAAQGASGIVGAQE